MPKENISSPNGSDDIKKDIPEKEDPRKTDWLSAYWKKYGFSLYSFYEI